MSDSESYAIIDTERADGLGPVGTVIEVGVFSGVTVGGTVVDVGSNVGSITGSAVDEGITVGKAAGVAQLPAMTRVNPKQIRKLNQFL